MIMILIGYARVSTINQNEDRQIQELIKYGVEEKSIYIDKQSGKDFHRPSYMKMLKRLKKGDVLVVKSIDAWYIYSRFGVAAAVVRGGK